MNPMNLAWINRSAILFALCLAFTISAARGDSPAMWRITDKDSEIWLFGTVHLLPPDIRWRTKRFDKAFAAADTVILEININPDDSDRIRALSLQLGHNANFATLSSILGPGDTARVARAASKIGIDPSTLEPLRPWLAAVQLSLLHIARQGFDPASGVDAVIANSAAAAGKRLAYFETIEDQFRVFASLSAKAETAFLMASVDQIEHDPGTLNQLVQAWVSGDTSSFDKQFKALRGTSLPDLHEALFVRRNKAWVAQIAHVMKGAGKALVAVGAGHLPGPQGVVSLLRARGFKVKRL
jgi:uncharacterized protein YbaP (TraB family)